MKLFESHLDKWNTVSFESLAGEWICYGYVNGHPFEVRSKTEAVCMSVTYTRLRVLAPTLSDLFYNDYMKTRHIKGD